MHHSKLPLTAWFWAAYLMATHSNGIRLCNCQRQLAFGSYQDGVAPLRQAWRLETKAWTYECASQREARPYSSKSCR